MHGIHGEVRNKHTRLLLPILVSAILGATSGGWCASPPAGLPLPATTPFELTRQSDLIVLVRPSSGDVVRVIEVIAGKKGAKSFHVQNFSQLWRGLRSSSTKKGKQPQLPNQAVLFLRRDGKRWQVCEMIPRARAANGCVWVRDGKLLWYGRNPWFRTYRLYDRNPNISSRRNKDSPLATVDDLRKSVRRWRADLGRLRSIDRQGDAKRQLRALRAFVHPSTQPPHSREAIALARQVYREVQSQAFPPKESEKPQPVKTSVWETIRGGSTPQRQQTLALVKSSKATERAQAIQQLRAAAAPELVAATLEALGDKSSAVRLAAAEALGDFADASCTETLIGRLHAIKNLKDPIRRPLLRALLTCGNVDAIGELILSLQEPADPFRRDVVYLLLGYSGLKSEKGSSDPRFQSAAYWGRWYEKRYKRELELKPLDFARLEPSIKKSPRTVYAVPASELELIPAATVDEIIEKCSNSALPNRAGWCDLLFRVWAAGTLADGQKRELLEAFGEARIDGRKTYPLGTTALLSVSSLWPSGVYPTKTLRFVSKSQVYVDGEATRPGYPVRYPRVYVYPIQPSDYGPGKHKIYVETEYTAGSGDKAFAHKVRTPVEEFEVVLGNEELGLEAKSDLALDERVERVFRFAYDDETTAVLSTAKIPSKKPKPKPPKRPRRYPKSGGGYIELVGRSGWELTEALPVDLALSVEYEMLDFGMIIAGGSIYVAKGTTSSGEFNPYLYRSLLRGLEQPGEYRFRIHLTPSRDVALTRADSSAYWDGYILVSPEMVLRLVDVPKKKSK